MPVDDAVKHLVQTRADAPLIKREAIKDGMRTLRQSALPTPSPTCRAALPAS